MYNHLSSQKKEYKKVFYKNYNSSARLIFKDFNSSSLLIVANNTVYLLRDLKKTFSSTIVRRFVNTGPTFLNKIKYDKPDTAWKEGLDFIKTCDSAPKHNTFTSSNIKICSQVRVYAATTMEPHSNLNSQEIGYFTGNGPDAH